MRPDDLDQDAHHLPHEAVQAVLLLFRADRHHPLVQYTLEGTGALIRCATCAAIIRWQWADGAWHPDTTGYQAGHRCGHRSTMPPAGGWAASPSSTSRSI